MGEFINNLLEHCVSNNSVTQFEEGVYLSTADAMKCDELLMKEKLIQSKINKYKHELQRARSLLSAYRKKNIASHLPAILKTQIIYQIPKPVLTKILDKCFSDNISMSDLVENVKSMYKQMNHGNIDVSDTEEKIFNSDEEEMLQTLQSKKRKRQVRTKIAKKQRSDSNEQRDVYEKEDSHNLASDLCLSDSEA